MTDRIRRCASATLALFALPASFTRAAFFCRLATTSTLNLPGVRVTATLTRLGEVIARRTVTLR